MLRRPIAVLAGSLLLALSMSVQASATTVLVMDTDRVLNTSAVGTHIRERLTAIGEEITTELSTEEASVRTEVEAFNTETADKTEEQIAADEALSTRRAELQNRVIQLGVSEQVKQRELTATRNAALEPVHAALQEVLEEVVAEKSADVLVERNLLIYVGEGADITDEVIEKLNAKMTEVPVERVRLPVAEEAPSGGGE
jgi:Skp family chaperone for outer membrane proteins